jgi:NAD(P)-dependent dehydrogenase (short-subunit alcohol dehydrogenase family)
MAGGFAMSGPVADATLDVWNRQISINLTTAFLTTRAFLPSLRRARGSIVLFAAQPALPGKSGPNMSAYAVAKSGVAALMRAIAAEERANGVRANALAPISIRTATNVASMGNDARYIEREQVADVVTFLCSSGASSITGEILSLS